MSGAVSGKKRFIKLAVVAVVIAIIAVVGTSIWKLNQRKAVAQAMMSQTKTVSTTQIEKMDLSNSISVTGTIESVDYRTITSQVKDVEVVEVLVSVGEHVEKGQVICRMDSGEIEGKLANSQNNYSVNQQLDALGDTPIDIYNAAIEKAQKTYASSENNYHTKATEYNEAVSARDLAKESLDEAFVNACAGFGIAIGNTEEDAAKAKKYFLRPLVA